MLSQTMGNELLVSVIVPVYNAERFVGRCIESIVGQTYGHIEVILVDDGSTDGSPAICDQWAERDARIQVVHKHNEGAGLARNVGLGRALGSYVCFVDADDYLCLDAIERMLDAVTGRSTDLVFFGFSDVDEQGTLLESHVPTPPHTFYEGREIVLDVLPHAIAPDYAAHSDWNIRLDALGQALPTRCFIKSDVAYLFGEGCAFRGRLLAAGAVPFARVRCLCEGIALFL